MPVQNTVRTIGVLCLDSAVITFCDQEEERSMIYSVGICDAFHFAMFWHCNSIWALLLCTANLS